MIIFKGYANGQAREALLVEYLRLVKLGFISLLIISTIVVGLIALILYNLYRIYHAFFALPIILICFILMFVYYLQKPESATKDFTWVHIKCSTDRKIEHLYLDSPSEVFFWEEISYIKNFKEYYSIQIGEHKDAFIICPKNLIVEGSIEEFEKLFEGKIVKNDSDITE